MEQRGEPKAPDESQAGAERPEERVSRELDELLQQLRITLPGVQVLFAFLLTVPFTQRFHLVNGISRDMFFVAFLTTTAATALLLAPVAYARIQFRQYDKERLIRLGTLSAIVGLGLLAVSLSASAFVVTGVLFSNRAAGLVAASALLAFALAWFVLPLAARISARRDPSVTDEF
jgi:hypothetical protein